MTEQENKSKKSKRWWIFALFTVFVFGIFQNEIQDKVKAWWADDKPLPQEKPEREQAKLETWRNCIPIPGNRTTQIVAMPGEFSGCYKLAPAQLFRIDPESCVYVRWAGRDSSILCPDMTVPRGTINYPALKVMSQSKDAVKISIELRGI